MKHSRQAPESAIGPDEVLFAVALVLLTIGTWLVVGAAALVLPGAVLLWLVLPTRTPFVDHTPPAAPSDRPVHRKAVRVDGAPPANPLAQGETI